MKDATIKICHSKSKTGYAVIYESDFDKHKHKLFKEKSEQPKKKSKKDK